MISPLTWQQFIRQPHIARLNEGKQVQQYNWYIATYMQMAKGGYTTQTQVTVVPASAPTINSFTYTRSTANVLFSVPTNTGGGSISNYQYSLNGGSTYTAFSPTQTSTPLSISGLTYGSSYSIRLKAVNAAGTGSASNASTATIPYTTPLEPSINSIPTDSYTTMSVNFTAPTDTGGRAITNYQYSIDNGSTYATFSPADSTSPVNITAGVAGLQPQIYYTIKLRALNLVGTGSESSGYSTRLLGLGLPTAVQITYDGPGVETIPPVFSLTRQDESSTVPSWLVSLTPTLTIGQWYYDADAGGAGVGVMLFWDPGNIGGLSRPGWNVYYEDKSDVNLGAQFMSAQEGTSTNIAEVTVWDSNDGRIQNPTLTISA
jgi:hypothetical protein